jgi:hypothetical protein
MRRGLGAVADRCLKPCLGTADDLLRLLDEFEEHHDIGFLKDFKEPKGIELVRHIILALHRGGRRSPCVTHHGLCWCQQDQIAREGLDILVEMVGRGGNRTWSRGLVSELTTPNVAREKPRIAMTILCLVV